MSKRITRRKLRGKPLDDDCKKAKSSTNIRDPRIFCEGLWEPGYGFATVCDKCKECGVFIENEKPLETTE